jgi:hypothetical protein
MKRIAGALVECGYACKDKAENGYIWRFLKGAALREKCDPYADTLAGRRQADALEDWLYDYNEDLWEESVHIPDRHKLKCTLHQWRLECIKWCFEQLEAFDE